MMNLRGVVVLVPVIFLLASNADARPFLKGYDDGYRLSGNYQVHYSRKAFGRPIWRMEPRCDHGACNTKIRSTIKGKPTGLKTVFRYRVSTGFYVARSRFLSNRDCLVTYSSGAEVTIHKAYVENSTFRIEHFAGSRLGKTAKYGRGTVVDKYRPTYRAQRQNCTDGFEEHSEVYLKRR